MNRLQHLPRSRDTLRFRQHGAATLLLSIVLLLVLTIVAAYASRSALLDLAITGNQARHKEAQSHAEAVLDCALALYAANGLYETGTSPRTPTQILNTECNQSSGVNATVYYLKHASTDPTHGLTSSTLFRRCPFAPTIDNLHSEGLNPGFLYAVGRSTDQSATYCVGVVVSAQRALGSGTNNIATITAAIATSAKLTGNLTVTNNNSGGVNIWTGTDISDMNGSFETKISIDGNPNQVSSEKDGNKFYVGPDVIFNDPDVRKTAINPVTGQPLPFSAFYNNIFGVDLASVIAGADVRLSAGQTLPAASDAYAGKVIYVNTGGSSFDPGIDLGTADKPVLLIVDGDLELNGNKNIYGTIVTKKLARLNGTVTIEGNLVAATMDTLNGTLRITAPPPVNPTDKADPRNFWLPMPVAGSWRDWTR